MVRDSDLSAKLNPGANQSLLSPLSSNPEIRRSQLIFMLVVAVGGGAILVSYVITIAVHIDERAKLWGTLEGSAWVTPYTLCMPFAAVGFFVGTVVRVLEATVADLRKATVLYAVFLSFSVAWMPLSFWAIDSAPQSALKYWLCQLDLAVVGVCAGWLEWCVVLVVLVLVVVVVLVVVLAVVVGVAVLVVVLLLLRLLMLLLLLTLVVCAFRDLVQKARAVGASPRWRWAAIGADAAGAGAAGAGAAGAAAAAAGAAAAAAAAAGHATATAAVADHPQQAGSVSYGSAAAWT